ncbi:hypothetical protein AB0D87_04345 [Streptomyces sp. NPDC048342]|uniref:hypothetical protein n=1 Tax=unclassified Streptomyces TaxID=2593676 RepID=UPI003445B2F8
MGRLLVRAGAGACGPTVGAGPRTPATPPPDGPTGTDPASPGGSRAFARPPAGPITGPDGRPALLVSAFIPKEEPVPGESGRPAYWREP